VYEVRITPEGLRHLNLLPPKVREAALSAVFGPIAANPTRLGKPLLGELEGFRSARRATTESSIRLTRMTRQSSSIGSSIVGTCIDRADERNRCS